jgi:hypothetical protein
MNQGYIVENVKINKTIFVENSYNQIKCPLCIFVSSQTESNSHYMYNL